MTNPIEEPLEGANEADVIEQTQDGDGSLAEGPNVLTDQANVADALEQGANVGTEGQDAYTRHAEETTD